MTQIIYLVGMKHTGKSRHGAALAEHLGWKFVDTDELIQELDSATGTLRRPVRDIYRDDGVERFRQLEAAACRLTRDMVRPAVVATGGGLCDNQEALRAVRRGVRVYLHDTLERLSERVFRGGIPAFLHTDDPALAKKEFALLYDKRVSCYRRMADLTVDLSGKDVAAAERSIVSAVEEHLNGRQ